MLTLRIARIFTIGLMILFAGVIHGQGYPNKVIRIVTSGGGGNDALARLIAEGISSPLGQPVVVVNRQTLLLGEFVAKSAPDGYTVLLAGTAFYHSTLLQKSPYDPIKDFSPISMLSTEPNILVVSPSVAANSVAELIALAKTKPGVLNYTSQGVGTSGQLAAELFKSMTGVAITHIPYKSADQTIIDLVAGRVDIRFGALGPVVPLAKLGKLKALAVTSLQPSALLPGLPAIAATVPGYEFTSGAFMFVPANTPEAIIKRLNQEVVRLLGQPEVKEKIFNSGQEVVASSPQDLANYLKSDIGRMGKVIKDIGIRID